MTKRATKRPGSFTKPGHWTNEPVPDPVEGQEDDGLSPTRYGDWCLKGIAVDF